MKKKLLFILISLFSTASIIHDSKADLQPQIKVMQCSKSAAPILKSILYFLILETILIHADDQSREILNEQLQYKNLLLNIVSNYGFKFFATICHELGHAYAAKLINGSQIDIHIGANSGSEESLLKIGGLSIDGFDPRIGYSVFQAPCENHKELNDMISKLIEENKKNENFTATTIDEHQQKDIDYLINKLKESPNFQSIKKNIVKINPLKRAIILLAGGISGIFGHFIAKTATNIVVNTLSTQHNSYVEKINHINKDLLKQSMLKACMPDQVYFNQIMNMLIPFNTGNSCSDGSKLWEECVGINPSIIRSIEKITPSLEIIIEQYLANIEATNQNANNQTIVLIGLLNYLYGGLVHLHV